MLQKLIPHPQKPGFKHPPALPRTPIGIGLHLLLLCQVVCWPSQSLASITDPALSWLCCQQQQHQHPPAIVHSRFPPSAAALSLQASETICQHTVLRNSALLSWQLLRLQSCWPMAPCFDSDGHRVLLSLLLLALLPSPLAVHNRCTFPSFSYIGAASSCCRLGLVLTVCGPM